ncbi:hypothetical protein EJ08DRAFT_645457 [Tothia fuscella]|uniref:Zn(2)-C6 fungal-type domain-containing protein n=1 Tax=Tothia fuscella TaxID=1048955 RepID=A0A9P4U2H0_9PEZI|nr:hypothetical protein EJ08DRAFT_645457 [Tothia fuscella]
MVGVPGRSKGCLTCKKRKKGCDQKRPICGQCQKAKIICGGYAPSTTFVPFRPERADSAERATGRDATALGLRLSPTSDSGQSLNRTASQSRIIDEYWQIFFPNVVLAQTSASLPIESMGSWAYVVQEAGKETSFVKTALLAVTLANLSRRSGEEGLRIAAIEAYSASLREVNLSLQDPRRQQSDLLLAVIKLLALYESSGGSGGSKSGPNWEKHSMGVTRLLSVRGPEKHTEDLAHALFLDARYQAATISIKQRKPCILAEREWMLRPWLTRPKSIRDNIIDIMLQLPAILECYDKAIALEESSQEEDSARYLFFQLCKIFDAEVQSFLRKLKIGIDAVLLARIENGIPEDFDMRHAFLAQTMAMYWAMAVLYTHTVQLAFQHFQISVPSPASSRDFFEPSQYALNIGRSVKYFFRHDAGKMNAHTFSYPLSMALQYMAFTQEAETGGYHLLTDAFTLGDTGSMIRDFLVSIQASASEGKINSDPQRHDYEAIRARATAWFTYTKRPSRKSSPAPNPVLGQHMIMQ